MSGSQSSTDALLEELIEFFGSDSLSEDGLREIIERYGCEPNNIDNYAFFVVACNNERVTEGIIRCLLEYFPNATGYTSADGLLTPLHTICFNKNATRGMVQLLIDANPESLRIAHSGLTPLHILCSDKKSELDNDVVVDILGLILEKCPEAARCANNDGYLPIHVACGLGKSPEFCRMLIEAYPGSERIANSGGQLPLHIACGCGAVATAEYLYKLYPESVNVVDGAGRYPIHYVFQNKNVSLGMVQLLVDAYPESPCITSSDGLTPLFLLCDNRTLDDDDTAVDILGLMLESCPDAARRAAGYVGGQLANGYLPIHVAILSSKSVEFCRMLIEAYPGSERIPTSEGLLPLHIACRRSTVALAKYLYNLYPESINMANHRRGYYPIHYAIDGLDSDTPATAVEMVQFLMDCDPNVASQKLREYSPLCLLGVVASSGVNTHASIEYLSLLLKIVHLLYNAHPEAIEDNTIVGSSDRFPGIMQYFINAQRTFARQARDSTSMSTRDENGQLPLHRALQFDPDAEYHATLGSIKLLVKGNPDALRIPDNDGSLPLHLAIQHHDGSHVPTEEIVDYLVGSDSDTLTAVDREGNTALHYACRSAKHGTIALLLEKYNAVSVSKTNENNKLPIIYFSKVMLWIVEAMLFSVEKMISNTRRVYFGF